MKSQVNAVRCYCAFYWLLFIGAVIGIVLLSIKVNHSNVQIESDARKIYTCYDYEKIREYGKLYKVCNNEKIENSEFYDIKNKATECDKICPQFNCIENTEIMIFSIFTTIKFKQCFTNVDKTFFEFKNKCIGADKCGYYNDYDSRENIGNLLGFIAVWLLSNMILCVVMSKYIKTPQQAQNIGDDKQSPVSENTGNRDIIIEMDDNCCICKESLISEDIIIRNCSFGGKHPVHKNCLDSWTKHNPNAKCFICKDINIPVSKK